MWPTWSQAAIAAAVSLLLAALLRRRATSGSAAESMAAAASEFALIATLYGIWRLARMLPLATQTGAIERAHDIVRLQGALHLPSELSLERFVAAHEPLASVSVWYYATVHVPALIAFIVWLYVRHRDHYPHWRNALALVTLGCLLIRFVRVAPPRLLPDLGYVDLAQNLGASVYGPNPATGVSDQFAAMPSIHVAWAAVVSFGIVAASTSPWRWLALGHIVATTLAVAATGNHWWLDGVVALLLLWAALALDAAARRRLGPEALPRARAWVRARAGWPNRSPTSSAPRRPAS